MLFYDNHVRCCLQVSSSGCCVFVILAAELGIFCHSPCHAEVFLAVALPLAKPQPEAQAAMSCAIKPLGQTLTRSLLALARGG